MSNSPKNFQQEQEFALSTPGGVIPCLLIRSARRRTIEIAVSASSHARVTAPRGVPIDQITHFIQGKADWILQKLRERRSCETRLSRRRYEPGHRFLFLGKDYPLEIAAQEIRDGIHFDGRRWAVCVPQDADGEQASRIKKVLCQWYRQQAKELLGTRTFHYARRMGVEPRRITVKTQKRLWGSCNHRGQSINLNWALVMAPLEVIDYVVVHELCHLEVPNHSKRFWHAVAKILPDYRVRQHWLKAHAVEMALP